MSHYIQTIIISLNRVQQFSYTTTNKTEQLYERQFMVSQSNRQSSSQVTIRKQNYKNKFLTIRIEICLRNLGFNVKSAIDTSLPLLFHYFRGHFLKQNCLTSDGGERGSCHSLKTIHTRKVGQKADTSFLSLDEGTKLLVFQ